MANAAAQRAYQILTGMGLSPGAATGVVGNLVAESGLRTDAVGDGGLARGIAQWHPDRYAGLVHWAMTQGLNPNALDTQVRYVAVEAQTGAGGNVWAELTGTTSAGAAAAAFMRKFERPADQSAAAASRRAQAGADALGTEGVWGKIVGGLGDLTPFGLADDLGKAAAGGDIPGLGAAQSALGVITWVTDPHNLLRVVYVVGGAAMILVGLNMMAVPAVAPIVSAVAPVGKVAKGISKVAA